MASVTVYESAIDALESASQAGENIYEAAISAGIQARESGDSAKWLIGDLALLIRKDYGQDTIGQFAGDIGTAVERVHEYRTVCKFYPRRAEHGKPARADFFDMPAITYSHMRMAMRLKDFDAALEFLEDCSLNRWKCEKAAIELKKLLKGDDSGAAVERIGEFYARAISMGGGVVELHYGATDPPSLGIGEQYRFVIYKEAVEDAQS